MRTRTKEQQYTYLTETPVEKLILALAIPTIFSMLVTNIYNLADTYFVSTLGNSASGATGIVFSLMGIIQAFGFTYGQGAGSILSRKLGAGEIEAARKTASTGFFASLMTGLLIMVFGLLFLHPLMRLLGSTETILPYAADYGKCILLAAPAFCMSCVLNNILRYEGKAVFSMFGLVSGSILNIFGDYLMVVCLQRGILGAGISTMIAQYFSVGILLLPFLKKQVQTRVSFRYLSHNPKDTLEIFLVGVPSLLRQGLYSVSSMTMSWCAGVYGDAAIAAMSIVSRLMNLLFCVCIGIGQGFQPVSAFNYGAKKYQRVVRAMKFMILFSTGVMCVTFLVGFTQAPKLIRLFRDDAQVIEIGTRALRFTVPALLFLPISTGGNMLCQSIGRKSQAAFLASARSGLFYIPIMIVFSHTFGLFGIEITQLVADIISVALCIPVMLSVVRSFPQDGKDMI